MPPCTLGCSVTTRWPRIAGIPVSSAMSVTGTPCAAISRAVPPLDSSRQPAECSPSASSTIPDLSYTESSAVGTPGNGNARAWDGREYRSAREQAQGARPERLADRRWRRHRAGVWAAALVLLEDRQRRCPWQRQDERLRLLRHRLRALAAHRRRRRDRTAAGDTSAESRQGAVGARP